MPISLVYNSDCLEAMRAMPDKCYDLAIVDPPYGIDNKISDGGKNCKLNNTPMVVLYKESTQWDIKPTKEYFDELFRVSKNQIICGGNYFIEFLENSRCVICWDKRQAMPSLSSWEFLWTSFDKPAKTYYGTSTDLNRFHPTQKPIALYKWLLENYAKKGDKILDTHLGSGSSRIAAYDLGFDFTGYELDADYFAAGEKRFKEHIIAHGNQLFKPEPKEIIKQSSMFDKPAA